LQILRIVNLRLSALFALAGGRWYFARQFRRGLRRVRIPERKQGQIGHQPFVLVRPTLRDGRASERRFEWSTSRSVECALMEEANRWPAVKPVAGRLGQASVMALAAVSLIGCAQTPTPRHVSNSHEYFSSKIYGAASPRVVADGQPIPHGGGVYLVGHAYKVAGHTYVPQENDSYSAVGMASWYGDAFHGRRTANGEVYDKDSISAAHPTMPLPSYARVTNLSNGHSIIVRVNDRGPFHGGRVMDVSSRVADALDFKGAGTAKVKVDYVGPAPLEGSDDRQLMASLRTDGGPATMDGLPNGRPVMVASTAAPVERVASAPPPEPKPAPPPPAPEMVAIAPAPMRPTPVDLPTPPARPFDLGTIPGATIPVAFTGPAVLPPRRPGAHDQSADNALYFADNKLRTRLDRSGGPFARLKDQHLSPLDQLH
jgi:rare lipoprotein A